MTATLARHCSDFPYFKINSTTTITTIKTQTQTDIPERVDGVLAEVVL
jgi:hypothetical protein